MVSKRFEGQVTKSNGNGYEPFRYSAWLVYADIRV